LWRGGPCLSDRPRTEGDGCPGWRRIGPGEGGVGRSPRRSGVLRKLKFWVKIAAPFGRRFVILAEFAGLRGETTSRPQKLWSVVAMGVTALPTGEEGAMSRWGENAALRIADRSRTSFKLRCSSTCPVEGWTSPDATAGRVPLPGATAGLSSSADGSIGTTLWLSGARVPLLACQQCRWFDWDHPLSLGCSGATAGLPAVPLVRLGLPSGSRECGDLSPLWMMSVAAVLSSGGGRSKAPTSRSTPKAGAVARPLNFES
jgi:hypothetical protein